MSGNTTTDEAPEAEAPQASLVDLQKERADLNTQIRKTRERMRKEQEEPKQGLSFVKLEEFRDTLDVMGVPVPSFIENLIRKIRGGKGLANLAAKMITGKDLTDLMESKNVEEMREQMGLNDEEKVAANPGLKFVESLFNAIVSPGEAAQRRLGESLEKLEARRDEVAEEIQARLEMKNIEKANNEVVALRAFQISGVTVQADSVQAAIEQVKAIQTAMRQMDEEGGYREPATPTPTKAKGEGSPATDAAQEITPAGGSDTTSITAPGETPAKKQAGAPCKKAAAVSA